MECIKLLNLSISNVTVSDFCNALQEGVIYTPNIDHFVLLQRDREFYDAYMSADIVLLDSQVMYLLYKSIGFPIKEKISGADIFPLFCDFHRLNSNMKIFILGGLQDVAQRVKTIINKKLQNKMIVGALSPSYGFEKKQQECNEIVDIINNSGATVLIVGVGTPKQEKWIYQYKNLLPNIKIFMGVGATLDFIVGDQKRAPLILQKCGLEWLYRLIHNPRKLASRYLIRDIAFFVYFFQERLNVYRNPFGK